VSGVETKVWVGGRIRAARRHVGLSQVELARQLHRTQTAVSYWESGKRAPGFDDLLELARLLGRDPAYFLPRPELRRSARSLVEAALQRLQLGELSGDIEELVAVAERGATPRRETEIVADGPIAAAKELVRALELSEPPVDVETVAHRCGVLIVDGSFHGSVSGVVITLEESAVIGIDLKLTQSQERFGRVYEQRRRFLIAHHLGHHLLGHHERLHIHFTSHSEQGEPPDHDWRHEREANEFAAELLMPEGIVRRAVGEEEPVERMAERFLVTPLMLAYRLIGLGLR